MGRLAGGQHVQFPEAGDIGRLEVFQMLQAVLTGGQGAVFCAGFLKVIQRLVDGLVADGVDAHRKTLLGRLEHQPAQRFGRGDGAAPVAGEIGVGVRLF